MSVAGIFGNSFLDDGVQNMQSTMQQMEQDFEQLGQDLQAGNLTAAQSDLATLRRLESLSISSASPSSSSSSANTNNPIVQAFSQLSQDMQSGNLSAAQQDYSTIQQDIQNRAARYAGHHHHSDSSSSTNAMSQLFSQLGQELQSGSLSSAQQTYSTMQQDLQLLGQSATQSTSTSSNTLSVNA